MTNQPDELPGVGAEALIDNTWEKDGHKMEEGNNDEFDEKDEKEDDDEMATDLAGALHLP